MKTAILQHPAHDLASVQTLAAYDNAAGIAVKPVTYRRPELCETGSVRLSFLRQITDQPLIDGEVIRFGFL